MKRSMSLRALALTGIVQFALTLACSADVQRAAQITVVAADAAASRIAPFLKKRIESRSAVTVNVAPNFNGESGYWILLGEAGKSALTDKACLAHAVQLPGKTRRAPESYAVKSVTFEGGPGLLAVGADSRGVLYAAGEVLRRIRNVPDGAEIGDVDIRSAPAYRFRGSSANQGGTMMRATGARGWTQDELFDVILDYAFAGANCFYTGDEGGAVYDFVKSLGLMSTTGARPNQLNREFPNEWKAGGREAWEGKNWVCPNVPEAHQALIEQWTTDFAKRADHDVMRFYAGDPGGCTDARCTPWGKTFVHLSEELAALWHKTHPDSIVLIANQGIDNAGDRYIFDYLNAGPRSWLYGLCYGPGSNAMSNYFRDHLRDDLFEYPGDGPVNRYLSETLRELPADQRIVHYSDITHWISAQYAVANPDPHVVRAYGRRTFHARPAAMYRIFKAIMPFSEGDIVYSEGYHDEFHQYIWNRLLWNPNQSLDEVLDDYCSYHFGQDAAPLMAEALLQMEYTLETPVAQNGHIDTYYALVKEAGPRIPPDLMRVDHRWRMHMQHAALDKHLQLRLRRQLDQEARVRASLEDGLKSGKLNDSLETALTVLREPATNAELDALRDEARALGEETNELFGIRDIGFFRMERPLRDLAGHVALIEKALKAPSRAAKRVLMQQCIDNTNKPTRLGNIFG
ncbi:MAG: hypothetical protein HUU46_23865 [Candidatus Hydrogenedentes bacterium]|nr:hypothetical protein [Candidatus Hydrogenedentota bacterium]